MPRTPRCICVDCGKTFDANQVRLVGDGLMRIFLAVRLSKRIAFNGSICQNCRSYFLHWKQKMEGDFNKYDGAQVESFNGNSDSVGSYLFFQS